jgi:hypothetical protein
MITHTIRDCLAGELLEGPRDSSREQLYYQTGITKPRARIFTNPQRPLNIVTAIARFVWLASGNNRVEDIAYYEPKVRNFSDDGLTVPGSDYGMRLFQPRPGLNQIQGVVDRLRLDPGSRQAAAVVWQPEDAVRRSGDIPCTFGLFFHIRKDDNGISRLNMSVNMRSNNAFRILPFNVFEFTLLQEVVAAELDVDLGFYSLWAASMHVYINEREWPATVGIGMDDVSPSIIMPEMPSHFKAQTWQGTKPLQQINLVAKLEASLRHAHSWFDIEKVLSEAMDTLDPYWLNLFEPLVMWGVSYKRGWGYDREWISDEVLQEGSLFNLAVNQMPVVAGTREGN